MNVDWGRRMRLLMQARTLCCLVLAFVPVLSKCSHTPTRDPRLLIFDKFLHAETYDEVKPFVSGVLAQRFASLDSKSRDEAVKGITSVRSLHYDPRIVDADASNSFLVFDRPQPGSAHQTRIAFLLSRQADGSWTVANRGMPDLVITSFWKQQ